MLYPVINAIKISEGRIESVSKIQRRQEANICCFVIVGNVFTLYCFWWMTLIKNLQVENISVNYLPTMMNNELNGMNVKIFCLSAIYRQMIPKKVLFVFYRLETSVLPVIRAIRRVKSLIIFLQWFTSVQRVSGLRSTVTVRCRLKMVF